MTPNALTISDVSVRSGENYLLRGVSFTVYPGQMMALVGSSGAGKSLCAQAVTGALAKGLDASIHTESNQSTAYLPQDPIRALDPLRTVRWHLWHAVGDRTRHADGYYAALLKRVGLSENNGVLDKYPHQLSGGMARRVTIAQCIVSNTDYLFVDEPTNGIEPEGITELMRLFKALSLEGTAIVLITHNLPLAMTWCDAGLLLEQGRQVEYIEGEAWTHGEFRSDIGHKIIQACHTFGVL